MLGINPPATPRGSSAPVTLARHLRFRDEYGRILEPSGRTFRAQLMARETCPAMLMITSSPAADSASSVTRVWWFVAPTPDDFHFVSQLRPCRPQRRNGAGGIIRLPFAGVSQRERPVQEPVCCHRRATDAAIPAALCQPAGEHDGPRRHARPNEYTRGKAVRRPGEEVSDPGLQGEVRVGHVPVARNRRI